MHRERVVTAEDVFPGWDCEACGTPFQPGDVAHGNETQSLIRDWRCVRCYTTGRPIVEHGAHLRQAMLRTVREDGRKFVHAAVLAYRR